MIAKLRMFSIRCAVMGARDSRARAGRERDSRGVPIRAEDRAPACPAGGPPSKTMAVGSGAEGAMGHINYQCLRGKIHAVAPAAPPTNPHLWVILEANGEQWFATINVRSDKDA